MCVHNWLVRFAAQFDPSIDTKDLGIGTMEDEYNIIPAFASVISWASLLLDTNYVYIATNSEKLHAMMHNMFACVDVLVTEFRDAVDVASLVMSLAEVVRKQRTRSSVYGISVLKLTEESYVKPEDKQDKQDGKNSKKTKSKTDQVVQAHV